MFKSDYSNHYSVIPSITIINIYYLCKTLNIYILLMFIGIKGDWKVGQKQEFK